MESSSSCTASRNTSGNKNLKLISCARTNIKKLDFSENKKIKDIYCMSCPNLETINLCNGNSENIVNLNCTGCINLNTIYIDDLNNISKKWKVPNNVKYELCKK